MSKKRVEFGNLKVGQKFRYKRRLYLKDDLECAVCISNGVITQKHDEPNYKTLVTPVKVNIIVL